MRSLTLRALPMRRKKSSSILEFKPPASSSLLSPSPQLLYQPPCSNAAAPSPLGLPLPANFSRKAFTSILGMISRGSSTPIFGGLLGMYQNLDLSNLRYLGIVVDSEEAKNTVRIKRLLCWLSSTGVKKVILYDMEGVLKKSIESDQSFSKSNNTSCFEGMIIELLSFSDNKEAVAKAASFLCSKYLKSDHSDTDKVEPVFTEADMANALTAVGCGGPDPDLLLVYGPARCHLGFPAWRMRYTEIIHMGSLKTMKYGAIVKAIYDFSKKHQNYGT